jgi:3-dehydroquinate synthetase
LEKFEFNKQLKVSFNELKPFIKIDKKNTSNLVNLVQLKAIGECKIVAIKNINSLKKFFN